MGKEQSKKKVLDKNTRVKKFFTYNLNENCFCNKKIRKKVTLVYFIKFIIKSS